MLAALGLAILTACASIAHGQSETVTITTRYAARSEAVTGAECILSNDKGTWRVITPGSVVVQRSYDALHVVCRLGETTAGVRPVRSKTSGVVVGNVLLGGIVGAGVDVATGAAYSYPDVISVRLCEASVDASGTRRSDSASHAPLTLDARVPFLNDEKQSSYRAFLGRPHPRAFAISTNGHAGWASGNRASPADPSERALANCKRAAQEDCDLYVVDDEVVYQACS